MSSATLEAPATAAEAKARMRECEREYKIAHRDGHEDLVRALRREYRELKDSLPALRAQERDDARREAAALGEERRAEAVELATVAVAAIGKLYAATVGLRALNDTSEVERLGNVVDSDLFAAVYRSALGVPPPAVTYLPWVAEMASLGIEVPSSIADDPAARAVLERHGVGLSNKRGRRRRVP